VDAAYDQHRLSAWRRGQKDAERRIVGRLGPRPRRAAAQDAAIEATAKELLASSDPLDALAAYRCAVEYVAWAGDAPPTQADYVKAIETVRATMESDPEQYASSVRAGVIFMARWAWSREGLQPGDD
jgi:hypothetical protein